MIENSATKELHFPPNLLRICIDNYEGENISGSIIGVATPKPVSFQGMADFTVTIDRVYNQVGQPQPFHVIRSFQEEDEYQSYHGSPKRYFSSNEVNSHKGKLLSLNMIMTSRKGAEWQGIFKNIDGDIIGKYKTILECINCIENYL